MKWPDNNPEREVEARDDRKTAKRNRNRERNIKHGIVQIHETRVLELEAGSDAPVTTRRHETPCLRPTLMPRLWTLLTDSVP